MQKSLVITVGCVQFSIWKREERRTVKPCDRHVGVTRFSSRELCMELSQAASNRSQISKKAMRSYLEWQGPAAERVSVLSLVAGTEGNHTHGLCGERLVMAVDETGSRIKKTSQISKKAMRSYLEWQGPAAERVSVLSLVAGTEGNHTHGLCGERLVMAVDETGSRIKKT
ncbi:hypothetical protein CRUP_005964 [Coryphaenoides rupestris]|nr:hypothetical protein CRUP_005964 [Coryphaenoides rupestris]